MDKKRLLSELVFLFIFVAFTSYGFCGEKRAPLRKRYIFSLKDLIKRAIAYSPEINESKMEILVAKSDFDRVRAAYLPQINITAVTGPVSDADEPIVREVGNSGIYKIHDPYNGGIGIFGRLDFTITQPLFTLSLIHI